MATELNLVNLQVRLSKDEHERLKAIARPGLQGFMRALIQDVVSGRVGYPYPAHRREHELLEQILQSDPAKAKQIRAILETYAEVAAARAGHKQTKAG